MAAQGQQRLTPGSTRRWLDVWVRGWFDALSQPDELEKTSQARHAAL